MDYVAPREVGSSKPMRLLIMLALVAFSGFAFEEAVAEAPMPKVLCLSPATNPAAPSPGAQSATFPASWGSSDAMTMILWREPCAADPAQTFLYLRVIPTLGHPFVCYLSFHLVQAAKQYTLDLRPDANYDFCDNVLVPITFRIEGSAFDNNGAFDLVFEGASKSYTGSLPAYVQAPIAGLWCNCAEAGTGYSLNVRHGVLVVTVFSYLATGEPTWYLVSGPIVNNVFTGTLDKYHDGQCISCTFKPATINGNDGVMKITFTSSTTGTMELPGRAPFPITPLAF
jgi:hypothetical protein